MQFYLRGYQEYFREKVLLFEDLVIIGLLQGLQFLFVDHFFGDLMFKLGCFSDKYLNVKFKEYSIIIILISIS